MKKITSIMVILAVLLTGLFVICPNEMTQDATANTSQTLPSYYANHLQSVDSADYKKALYGQGDIGISLGMPMMPAVFSVGQRISVLGQYTVLKGYVFFDTGAIPDDYQVLSAVLGVYTEVCPSPSVNFDVLVSNVNIRATLDANMAEYNTNGTYEGIILSTDVCSIDYLYEMNVIPELVNKISQTTYKFASSREGINPHGDEVVSFQKNSPFLRLVLRSSANATVTYNWTATPAWNNVTTIFPVEVISHNNTWEQVRYEVYYPGCDWFQVWMNVTYIFQSVSIPSMNVTNMGGGIYNCSINFNMGGWQDYIHFWFLREKAVVTTNVHCRLWHSTLGEGQPDWRWKVVINNGMVYNNTTAKWVSNPLDWPVDYGGNYTISVLDFFDNMIVSHSFVANAIDVNILIPMSIPTLLVTNLRTNGSARMNIYFNITGAPYTATVPAGYTWILPIRSGSYMVRVDYMSWSNTTWTNTLQASYFENITVTTQDFDVYIGDSMLTWQTYTIGGIVITLSTIETNLMPSQQNIYYLLPGPPVGGSRSGLSGSEIGYVWRHPYKITEATVSDNDTGTAQTFLNQRPTSGTVRWNSDKLYITGSNFARVFINSSGSNLCNFTGNPGIVDLAPYNVNNFTLWSNLTLNCHRFSEFRQVEIFYWMYYADTLKYTISQDIDNNLTGQWTDVYWFVGFATNNNGDIETAATDSILVWDIDNNIKMDCGRNYDVTQAGICMHFDYLNATTSRQFQFTYWLSNATSIPQSTPIISIRTYGIEAYNGVSKFVGQGMWVNNRTAGYQGDIAISLKSLTGVIDPSSVVVFDTVGNREIFNEYYTVSGSTVTLNSEATGTVASGESREYKVYYLFEKTDVEPFLLFDSSWRIGWIQINAHLTLFLGAIMCAGYGTVELITARKQQTEAKGFGWVLIGTFLMLAYLGTWLLHSTGVL